MDVGRCLRVCCAWSDVTSRVRTARINRYHDMPCSNDIDIISNYWYWCPPLIGIHISTDTFPISSMDACALSLHSLELSFFQVASPSLYSFTLCVHENAIESMFLYRERERAREEKQVSDNDTIDPVTMIAWLSVWILVGVFKTRMEMCMEAAEGRTAHSNG